ncbi:nitroreductase family protein [Colwellia sp. C1TZA3]|uniref:nitroreductase family protein n=1 Tax=Colwellia sp. C1TZA3 TaxID=2508879 RepID=UPI00174C407D|nr:nitroreductase family protein [Colwellia sp. C1TZA3]
MKARVAYLKYKGRDNDSSVLLRRNIHRIEKGLIMQPQKPIFALSYITETINEYVKLRKNTTHDKEELIWAKEVLSVYFDTIDENLLPQKIKIIFEKFIDKTAEKNNFKNVPYSFANKVISDVTFEQFFSLCNQRRSVRWFTAKAVSRTLLEKAINIASTAPSACNRQPFMFNVVDQQPLLATLASLPLGTKGFAHNIQCLIVVTGNLSYYPTERDRHLIYIDSSLASMQFMLALETLGLSSCALNWPDIEQQELKIAQILNLSDIIRPTMLIAVGHAKTQGKIPYSQKKSAQQLINYMNHENCNFSK